MPAPAFQPPDQPAIDRAAVSPALQADDGTRGIGSRLAHGAAFIGLGLLMAGIGWQAARGVTADGWDAGAVWFWAGVAELLCAVVWVWVGLAFIQDAARLIFTLRLWGVQLVNAREDAAAQRKAAGEYGRRWYGTQPTAPPPVVVNDEAQRARLAEHDAAIARIEAQLAASIAPRVDVTPGAQAQASTEAARVAPPADADTRPMTDARALLLGAYRNGPAYRFVAAAWRGDDLTARAWTDMSSGEWRALTALLGEVGALVKDGQTRPWRLADAARKPAEADTHRAVLGLLWAAGVAHTRLPGDLYQRAES